MRLSAIVGLALALGLFASANTSAASPTQGNTIVAGIAATCALIDGTVTCWGNNNVGMVGDGSLTHRTSPVRVANLDQNVTALSAGAATACALDGAQLWCWGDNEFGLLGTGQIYFSSPSPVPATALAGLTHIRMGGFHGCGLTAQGGVECWGGDSDGELGDGKHGPTLVNPLPSPVIGLQRGVVAVTAGGGHSCALTSFGTVRCWGQNFYDQLGAISDDKCQLQLGAKGTPCSANPLEVHKLAGKAISVVAGGQFTCAIIADGSVQCWGLNLFGQLGAQAKDFCFDSPCSRTPLTVTGLDEPVTQLALGSGHACALTASGGVKCWGENISGELGDGTTASRSNAADVVGLQSGVVAIAVGDFHSCALMSSGGVKCWGANDIGELGDGTTTDSLVPVDVLLSPTPTCTPGEIINDYVHVDTVLPDGFAGPATDTLLRPTGETLTVHVDSATNWIGPVQSLAGVTPGLILQAVGPRQPDCSVVAVNVFSPGPPETPAPAPALTAPATGEGDGSSGAIPWLRLSLALAPLGLAIGIGGFAVRRPPRARS
ncbi:MAG: hypothetical protein ABSG55_07125 [Dehalococcoidia bacterium]|jgi:alpha-tubulin suppressor-like RCC1 family protein